MYREEGDTALVYLGHVYTDKGQDKPYLGVLGFFGAEWKIKLNSGEEWFTNNLWSHANTDQPDNCIIYQLVKRRSPVSGTDHERWLPMITPDQQHRLQTEHIQAVLTNYTDSEREFIMTGITDEEWDATFGE